MKYIKNNSMEFLEIDDENIVVYDPAAKRIKYTGARLSLFTCNGTAAQLWRLG